MIAELDADGNEKCWYTRGIEIMGYIPPDAICVL